MDTTRFFGALVATVTVFLSCVVWPPSANAQCLFLKHPHEASPGIHRNPDSIMVDTCDANLAIYANRWFEVRLVSSPLSSEASPDEFGNYDISDFDLEAADFALWDSLSDANSGVIFRRAFTDSVDVEGLAYRTYHVAFGDYVKVVDIVSALGTLTDIEQARYVDRHLTILTLPPDVGLKPLKTQTEIAAPGSFVSGTYHKRMYELGWQSGIYQLHLPLAWEVTKGSNNIYVGVDDTFNPSFSGTQHQHQDLTLHTASPAGNYFNPGSVYQGSTVITPLHDDGHGYQNLHIIAAQESVLGYGLVGVAPKVRVFGTQKAAAYENLDISNTALYQYPHVMSAAYFDGTNSQTDVYHNTMKKGIAVVSTLDNNYESRNYYADANSVFHYYGSHTEGSVTIDEVMRLPKLDSPGKNVYSDDDADSDPSKDIRVLCVMGYSQPFVTLADCSSGFRGAPMIGSTANFSIGVEKFSTLSSAFYRRIAKTKAAVDVVVPFNQIGAKYDGGDKYTQDVGGTSRCVPQLAGVVGLMMSVHERLGLTGRNVQARVYDIVTFTADKIMDAGIIDDNGDEIPISDVMNYTTNPELSELDGTTRYYSFPNQLFADEFGMTNLLKTISSEKYLDCSYRNQTNDPLGRYWAIRTGFGRVNAFRCVAHSIPSVVSGNVNVKYEYTGSENLNWTDAHTINGLKFLHLGKFKDATHYVLNDGGVAAFTGPYLSEPAHMNSNGKTLVNVDDKLTVGSNQRLVIDGIVTKTSGYGKIESASTGKILATGWIQNVDLEGPILTTDLRVMRNATGNSLKFIGLSEIHDTLWVRGKSNVVVESGVLNLMPGATIYLYNDATITVKDGATLIMGHGSRIIDLSSGHGTRVIVEGTGSGGKLTIADGAENVVINADVQVKEKGQFIVNGADGEKFPGVTISKITVEGNGKFVVDNGSFVKRNNPSSTTPVLILNSSEKLTVPASETVRLDIPIEIKSGAKIEVGEGATLKVGALTCRSGGMFEAKAGSTVQFLDQVNTIHGKLLAIGAPGNEVKFEATNESITECSALNRKNFVELNVNPGTEQWLFHTAWTTQPIDAVLNGYFYVQHAEFTNVYTTIKNMPILTKVDGLAVPDLLQNCTFKAVRSAYDNGTLRAKAMTLLHIDRDASQLRKLKIATTGSLGSLGGIWYLARLTIDHCKFYDDGGMISNSDYRSLRRISNDYPVAGIVCGPLQRLTITNSDFAYLFWGVNSTTTWNTYISECKFGGHADAIVCGSGMICENAISGCVDAVRSRGVFLYDNTIGAVMNAVTNPLLGAGEVSFVGSALLQSGNGSYCRNNTIKNYWTGLHAVSGYLEARDRAVGVVPAGHPDFKDRIIGGRNEFISTDAANPYRNADDAESDVFLDNAATVALECGLNKFSQELTFKHLFSRVTPITINVKTNDFDGADDLSDIRCNGLVTPIGTILNLSGHAAGNCESLVAEADAGCLVIPDYTANNDGFTLGGMDNHSVSLAGLVMGSWDDIDTTFAKKIYNVYSSLLTDNARGVPTRLEAITLMSGAVGVHPKSDSITTVFIATLAGIGLDTSEPAVLREAAIMTRVDLLVRSDLYHDAQLWLDSARISLFSGYDSLHVNYSSLWLEAKGDTTLTLAEQRDTVNAIIAMGVEHAKRPGSLWKQPIPRTASTPQPFAITVYPNPSNDVFTLRYEGAPMPILTVRMLDLLGNEQLRLNRAAVHYGDEVVIANTGLQNGSYLVEVSNGFYTYTTIISILR